MLPHALSPRLQMVYGLVPACSCVADVGVDHGFLLAALLESGKCLRGFGGDVNPGPLSSAERYLTARGLQGRALLVLSDGCERLPVAEIGAFVFAGMGGELIADLILRCPGLRDPGKVLICQPMTRPHVLRERLCAEGFALTSEAVCAEDRRIYVASAFRWDGVSRRLTEAEARAGRVPLLAGETAKHYLRREVDLLRKVANVETDRARAAHAAHVADELAALCPEIRRQEEAK